MNSSPVTAILAATLVLPFVAPGNVVSATYTASAATLRPMTAP